jgi:hypothetical protein
LLTGHVLRAHHRDMQTIHVWTVGSGRVSKPLVSRLRLNLRADDQLKPSDWHIRIRFRSDPAGIATLCHRLKQLFPEWIAVADPDLSIGALPQPDEAVVQMP